jgi:endonuclease/exonuclease/phosphatase family metal-dependent hydrolase
MMLRVMSWNIHSGIGQDGRFDLDRILAVISRHAPDILAVQEVESRDRGNRPSPFVLLQGHLERDGVPGHAIPAETMRAADGAYGHMLLSRWPLRRGRLHDLSVAGFEPRSAIEACVATPAGPLHVLSTHLGLAWKERMQQAQRLAMLVRAMPDPVMVLGDFNDWSWRGPVWKALSPLLPGRTAHRTFPARCPVLGLDRIYCRPAGLLGRSHRDVQARRASDHLPVIAELHLGRGS